MSLTSYRAAPPRAKRKAPKNRAKRKGAKTKKQRGESSTAEKVIDKEDLMCFAGLATTYSPRS